MHPDDPSADSTARTREEETVAAGTNQLNGGPPFVIEACSALPKSRMSHKPGLRTMGVPGARVKSQRGRGRRVSCELTSGVTCPVSGGMFAEFAHNGA